MFVVGGGLRQLALVASAGLEAASAAGLNVTVVNLQYTSHASTTCEHMLPAASNDDVSVRSNQCFAKCRPGAVGNPHGTPLTGWPYFCDGYLPTVDREESNALCLSPTECESLCSKLDECWGYAVSVSSQRCFLLSQTCQDSGKRVSSAAFTLFEKGFGALPSCPMGLGVAVSSSKFAEAAGLYSRESDALFAQLDGRHRVEWHASGCGYAVTRPLFNETVAPPPAATCADDDAAANFAFFQGRAEGDAHGSVCATGALWTGTYCQDPIFNALCAASCGGSVPACTGDEPTAAAALLQLNGVAAADASQGCAHAAVSCSDPIYRGVCKATCASARRLAAAAPAQAAASLAGLRNAWGDKLRARLLAISGSGPARALQTAQWQDLYWTFPSEQCTPWASANPALLDQTALYDVTAFAEPVAAAPSGVNMRLSWNCPARTNWFTKAGYYCQHRNLAAAFNTDPEVVNNQCRNKCGSSLDGSTGNFCDGNSAAFRNNSNALCLPREQCEALCARLSDCASIDVLRTAPRCYLNTHECVAGHASLSTADGIYPNATFDLVVPSFRTDRDVYRTFTAVHCIAGGNTDFTSRTRAECEDLCSADATCTGFNFVRSFASTVGTCSLRDAACDAAQLADAAVFTADNTADFVQRSLAEPCEVTVYGDRSAEGGPAVAGEYTGDARSQASVYLREDNRTRVAWTTDVAGQCNSWQLEVNGWGSDIQVSLWNCTDEVDAANLVLFGTNTASHMRFPCEFGAERGDCATNAAFRGVCAHSCEAFLNVTIAGSMYWYQNTELSASPLSSCLGDNNEGIIAAMAAGQVVHGSALTSAGGSTACLDLSNFEGTWYNTTHSPCHYGEFAPVVQALCRATCSTLPPPAAPPTAPPSDESDWNVGQSAPYGRRLQPGRWGRLAENHIEVSYLPADHATWTAVYRTQPNGTDGVCSSVAGPVDESQLSSIAVYHLAMPQDAGASMQYVCREASTCPELTTCVLGRSRMQDELALWRTSGAAAGPAGLTSFVESLAAPAQAWLLDSANFVPHTLVSADRVEATLVYDKWEFGRDLFRSVPAAPLARVYSVGLPDSKLVLTMASPVAFDGTSAAAQLGRAYPVPARYQGWKTDVVRIERFHTNGTVLKSGRFDIDLYAPGVATLSAFTFAPGAAEATAVPAADVTSLTGGWFRVRLWATGVDLVATEDVYECAADTVRQYCHEKATCTEKLGAEPDCFCAVPYVGDGETCYLKSYEYGSRPVPLDYFRLRPGKRMDFGWRVSEIRMYTDDACTAEFTRTQYGSALHVSASASYPQYAGTSYVASNVFDADPGSEWWSECLTCLPEGLGSDDAAAAWVQWGFQESHAGEHVRCIKMLQNGNHAASSLVLERGPAQGTGCGLGADQKRCRATQTWTVEVEEGSTEVTIRPTCGLADTQILGEMLVNPSDSAPTGNYHDVPSACACQALCLDHVEEGCRSWKYYEQFRHCILQTGVFQPGDGYWGASQAAFPGWTSGDFQQPGAQRVTHFTTEPAAPRAGEAFSLKVHGVGMPWHHDRALDGSPRQRIKLVREEQACHEEMPATVAGLACSRTEAQVQTAAGPEDDVWHTICSPRPASASAAHAQFTGLTLAWAHEERAYKVCYCSGLRGCYEPGDYTEVPAQRIKIGAATFEWMTEPKRVLRRMQPSSTFTVSIRRPAFGSYSDNTAWRLKVVRAMFGCGVEGDPTRLTVSTATPEGVDASHWTVTINSDLLTAVEAGDYAVCFSEGTGLPYSAIPSEDKRYLEIERLPEDSTTPRGLFLNQKFSAQAGVATAAVTSRLTPRGARLVLPPQDVLALADEGSTCGASGLMTFQGVQVSAWQADDRLLSLYGPTASESDEEALAYDIGLWDVAPGKYKVCHCDASADAARNDLHDPSVLPTPRVHQPTGALTASLTYALHDDRKCSSYLDPTTLAADWAAHQCQAKCARGCTGPSCFCEKFEDGTTPTDALCLSPALCREACDATGTCFGADIHEGTNLCYLTSVAVASAGCAGNETFVHLEKHSGYACTNQTDFTELGTLYVTDRVHTSQDYVLTPGEPGSIEITAPEGASLTYDAYGTSKDRIMIIDCKGTCGSTAPAASVTLPENAQSTSTWNLFWPMGYFVDMPHADDQNPVDIPEAGAGYTQHVYGRKPGFYCPGNNFNLDAPENAELKQHQCYTKCSLNAPCVGTQCFCGGHYAGFDGASSNALCLNEVACRDMCDRRSDCTSYDMHANLTRCFLNTGGCDSSAHDSMLGQDPQYTLVQKLNDGVDQGNVTSGPASTRRMQAAVDYGYSWDRLLRFAPVQFASGGTFKVCFCDSALLANGTTCASIRDYTIEVGKVHASGVSCMLADPAQRFTKGTCVPQRYKGHRCYREGQAVPVLPVPALAGPQLEALAFSSQAQLDTWCLYGPEELTRQDARCQAVAGAQSAV